jgi:hypothetical protein
VINPVVSRMTSNRLVDCRLNSCFSNRRCNEGPQVLDIVMLQLYIVDNIWVQVQAHLSTAQPDFLTLR